MINTANSDPIGDAVEHFEHDWTLCSRDHMYEILDRYGLSEDSEAIAELVRVDMDLRYKVGHPTELEDYLDAFGDVLRKSEYLADVAYEDYRLRTQHGHSLSLSRWQSIPNIQKANWYQELRSAPSGIGHVERNASIGDEPLAEALQEIGFYPVLQLGAGQQSMVYLATQNELAGRYVVLKVVHDKSACEPHNMAMLQHTNIVPVFSFHRLAGRLIICMPYSGRVTLADFQNDDGLKRRSAGESLCRIVHDRVESSLIRRGHEDSTDAEFLESISIDPQHLPAADDRAVLLPLENLRELDASQLALWLFQRIAAGLAHSHARGVVHGDLKPENILIRNDGEPALLDFNLSSSKSRPNQFIGGTLPYMSPETYEALIVGKGDPTPESDVYGTGVLLFRFVTGQLPYSTPETSEPSDLKLAIQERKNALVWPKDDSTPVGLRSIIERCLAFDRRDRYQTAEPLEKDLSNELSSLPLVFAKESKANRARKWSRRHPSSVMSMLLVGLLICIAGPLAYWGIVHRNRSNHVASLAYVEDLHSATDRALTRWMVDPQRQLDEALADVKQPLENYKLLSGGLSRFVPSSLSKDEIKDYEILVWRYIGQLSLIELRHLRATTDPNAQLNPDSDQFKFVRQLIEFAKTLSVTKNSRALSLIESEVARLAGTSEVVKPEAEVDVSSLSSTEQYLEAVRLMTRGRLASAITLLSEQDGETPPSLRLTLLGRSQYEKGAVEDAVLTFTQALEYAPDASRLYHMRGLCYHSKRSFKAAIKDFDKALELEPNFVFGLTNRGIAKHSQGRYEAAVQDFTSALAVEPKRVRILVLRSNSYRDLGETKKSREDYELAISIPTSNPKSLLERAKMRRGHKDVKGSRDDCLSAINEDREFAEAYYWLADIYFSEGENEEALRWFGKALELKPSYEQARIDRAVHYARMGKRGDAIEDLRQATLGQEKPRTTYQAACLYAQLAQQGDDKDKEIAFRYLVRSILRGYRHNFQKDSDIKPLRDHRMYEVMQMLWDLAHEDVPY